MSTFINGFSSEPRAPQATSPPMSIHAICPEEAPEELLVRPNTPPPATSIRSPGPVTPLVGAAPESFSPSSTTSVIHSFKTVDTSASLPKPSPYPLFWSSDPSQSKEFWFNEVTIIIKVENTLYKLYKEVLIRQSNFIREKLETTPPPSPPPHKKKKYKRKPTWSSTSPLGTVSNPLVLDVVKSDFEVLLSFMFPQDYTSQHNLAVKEWTAIASVATKLEFNSIRVIAINKIQNMSSPIDLIELGRKHTFSQLFMEGFRLFCQREGSLSLQEAEKVGLACVVQIAHARDMLAKGSLWSELEPSIEPDLAN